MDKIETCGNSLIQHGKESNRIYLMKYSEQDSPVELIECLEKMAEQKGYSKIFIKVPESKTDVFIDAGYILEAKIPGFFSGKTAGCFLALYLDPARSILDKDEKEKIDQILSICEQKKSAVLPATEFEFRALGKDDLEDLAALYSVVFKTYPFPIHNVEYLYDTMQTHVRYYGAFADNRLVAASSAETEQELGNAEMTDFATHPEFRGHGLALYLLKTMEEKLRDQDFYVLYTIARAVSAGMNITFAKAGYAHAGTLVNNTQISGTIESMNVWYRLLVT